MTIADKKLAGEDWIDVIAPHTGSASARIARCCTGHVESIADRVEHLSLLRDLQDESHGFLAYIPLAYHPDNNELGNRVGRQGTATTGLTTFASGGRPVFSGHFEP